MSDFFKSTVASAVPFARDNNNFLSSNVQAAIEELDFRSLTKEPTGFANRLDSTIVWDNTNRRFSIQPVGLSFVYYIKGVAYKKESTETVDITDTEGLWYIYFEENLLKASQTAWEFGGSVVFVATVYWDSTNKKALIFADERHGLTMDWSTHQRFHDIGGLEISSGSLVASNYYVDGLGNNNADAQISLSNGYIYDEDLVFHVRHASSPSQPFEQVLQDVAKIPIYYRLGSETAFSWRKLDATNFPLYPNSPNTAFFNKLESGNWVLSSASNKSFIATWILATNNINEPIIGILGTNEQPNISTASRLNVLAQISDVKSLVSEFKFLYRLIFQTDTTYTNAPRAVLRGVSSSVSEMIEPPPKGVNTFPFELHYVSGTGLNTTMSNGSFFRVRPGTFLSGSYSGYPAAFPLQMPYRCKLYSIVLTFREASFDWSAVPGPLLFELEFRSHYYNGSDVKTRVVVSFGNFSGSSTGHSTWRYELFENSWTYIDPVLPKEFEYAEMIGVRFVKAPSGARRINSWTDIVLKLNFEEVVV